MKFCKMTFGYIKKHFFQLLLLAILPAIALMLTSKPNDIIKFLVNYENQDFSSFKAIYLAVTQISWMNLLWFLMAGIVVCVFISAISSVIDRNMRFGVFRLRKFFRSVNENLIGIFIVSIVFFLLLEIFGFLSAVFLYFFSLFESARLGLGLSMLAIGTLVCILMTCYVYLLMWTPTMVITGLSSKKSLSHSIRYTKGNFWRLAFAVVLPIVPAFIVFFLDTFFKLKLFYLFNTIIYAFAIMYYTSLMFVAYFEVNEIEREDLKGRFNLQQ